jgi:SOS-response transcriptional repressor LexA
MSQHRSLKGASTIAAKRNVLKRFERVGEAVHLLPRNPAYQPIIVRAGQDLAIEGVFCGLVRQG